MYKADAYHKLERHITHLETVRRYVDLARTFRSMAYGGTLSLSSTNGQYSHDSAHEVTLTDSLRTDALNFLAQRCEDIAAKLDAGESPNIDIREACKV
jgi:hypothetical protein